MIKAIEFQITVKPSFILHSWNPFFGKGYFMCTLNIANSKTRREETYMKNYMTLVIALFMTLGYTASSPVLAHFDNEQIIQTAEEKNDKKKEENSIYRNEIFLKYQATELGIDTDDKDVDTLAKEIRRAKMEEAAKKLGIDPEGKDPKELGKEMHQAIVLQKAEELGIETEEKDPKTLAKEVQKRILNEKAEELGIETKGKDLKQLKKDVMKEMIQLEADKVGVETEGKDYKEIMEEIHVHKLFLSAEQLGIDTKDKEAQQILEEIIIHHAEKAKELKLFPFEEEKGNLHKSFLH